METECERILAEIDRVRAMLYKNGQLFDLSEDDENTEALIYEHKALSVRYSALLAKAKELGITRGMQYGNSGFMRAGGGNGGDIFPDGGSEAVRIFQHACGRGESGSVGDMVHGNGGGDNAVHCGAFGDTGDTGDGAALVCGDAVRGDRE